MDRSNLADLQAYGGVALALGLGLLIGIQRGWALRDSAPGTRFAGIRTFGLLALAGGLAGHLFDTAQGMATVILGATAALVVLGYWRTTRGAARISGTTSLVGVLTLACGFLAATGESLLATSVAASMVLLLAMRNQLHGWIGRLDEREVIAIARFAIIALVILPLLPDRAYGPYHAWNPRQLWMVVVLVSGFSFLGYIANKRLGASRGTIATAAAGSVVSSTAVTASLAARLRDGQDDPGLLSAGVAAASVVMFARVLALVAVLSPFALPTLAALAAPGILVSLAATAWLMSRVRDGQVPTGEVAVRNPFDLVPALLLAAMVMALTLAAHWVLDRYGNEGLAVVLAISGVVDVDSAIITMGSLPAGTLEPRIAALVLVPPVVLNTFFKAGIALSLAGWKRGWRSAVPLAGSALAVLAAVPFFL